MAENSSTFWLLTFEYFKKDVKKPEDNLIILVHWLLLKNNFQVLGLGNESKIDENEQLTDILPTNWSQNETYKFQYMRGKELFLLNGVKAGDSFIFNFYNVTTKHVSSAAIGNISSAVQWISDLTKYKDNFYETIYLVEKDLIHPMKIENVENKNVSTQTIKEEGSSRLKSAPHFPIHSPGPIGPLDPGRINPFPSYGMPDLDPLGGLRDYGGMLYNPLMQRRPGALPGVPPMARFDPMSPLNPDPMMPGSMPGRPRRDHMRPPDFDDSLYM